MDLTAEVLALVGKPESETLEYKAVLPPSKNIAQLISAFANNNGGYIILGVLDNLEVNGLSGDFHANAITHKAIDMLNPQPTIHYQYVLYQDKKIYAVKVEKSASPVTLGEKIYKRIGATNVISNPSEVVFKAKGYIRITQINDDLQKYKNTGTNSLVKLLEHYQSILKIFDDLSDILYPIDPDNPTGNQEGKILSRILYSSFVDNFETYLSDLLYEIYLAHPSTLKSQQTVTIEEVLNCSDLQDFIKYWSKQKLSKLQKGSVKGFIKDNKQISELKAISPAEEKEVEKILQIRHLYIHRNGIVDEKFLEHFAGIFNTNAEHIMSFNEICDKMVYLCDIVVKLDEAAVSKYNLAEAK